MRLQITLLQLHNVIFVIKINRCILYDLSYPVK